MEPTDSSIRPNNQPIISFASPWADLATLLIMVMLGVGLAIPVSQVVGPIIQVATRMNENNVALITKYLLHMGVLVPVWLYMRSIPALFHHREWYIYPILLSISLVSTAFILIALLSGVPVRTLAQAAFLRKLGHALLDATISPMMSEFIFRGVLQNIFHSLTKNIHTAIFITALIGSMLFSVINPWASVPLLMFNTGLGYLYWRTGHLVGPLLIANLFTAVVTIVSFMQTVSAG